MYRWLDIGGRTTRNRFLPGTFFVHAARRCSYFTYFPPFYLISVRYKVHKLLAISVMWNERSEILRPAFVLHSIWISISISMHWRHTWSFHLASGQLKGKVCLMKKLDRETHFLFSFPPSSLFFFAYFECGKYQIKTGKANCNLKQIPTWNETCRTQREIQHRQQ